MAIDQTEQEHYIGAVVGSSDFGLDTASAEALKLTDDGVAANLAHGVAYAPYTEAEFSELMNSNIKVTALEDEAFGITYTGLGYSVISRIAGYY